jgi:phosphoribosyl-AMP cyclohydrolase
LGSLSASAHWREPKVQVKNRTMSIILTDPARLSHDAIEEGDLFAPCFDDKGLVTAITVEATTGAVLMLAHMNAEALSLTLSTGLVHYYSRSRGTLWKKGETSGEVQKLVEIRADCDQDALLVLVEATGRGAACHTGRKTCFYRRVEVKNGEAHLAPTGEGRLFDPNLVYNR